VAPAPTSTARYPQDFPDPFVFRAGAFWYAMSTQRGLAKVPVIRSTDLVHWEDRGDALPALPRWSHFGAVWAPSVLAAGAAGFVLYYATPDEASGLQCISYAVSALPDGPYVDTSSGPLVCQTDRGGSIDPSPFRDADGRPWLVWKSEGTLDGEPTRIWSQPLSEDGRGLFGQPTELLSTAQAWEQPIVEAPSMARIGGTFHLFYSGNRWETSAYGVGHARCDGPAGPCHRTAPSPVLAAHPSEAGAGSGEVFFDVDGSPKLAYHAWDPSAVGYPGGLRRLRIGAVRVTPDGAAAVDPLVP
jgi:beta-xylosidase